MNRKIYSLLLVCMGFAALATAQTKIGGVPGPSDAGAYLQLGDASGADKGLLFSRISLTATTTWGLAGAGGAAQAGMVVYNTNAGITGATANGTGLYYWDGTKWVWMKTSAAADAWLTKGNTGTNSGTNFLGTTDNVSLRMRTNNQERMVVDSLGNVGINTPAPTSTLTVNGSMAVGFKILTSGTSYTVQPNDYLIWVNTPTDDPVTLILPKASLYKGRVIRFIGAYPRLQVIVTSGDLLYKLSKAPATIDAGSSACRWISDGANGWWEYD